MRQREFGFTGFRFGIVGRPPRPINQWATRMAHWSAAIHRFGPGIPDRSVFLIIFFFRMTIRPGSTPKNMPNRRGLQPVFPATCSDRPS
jgi:hypothetical protein